MLSDTKIANRVVAAYQAERFETTFEEIVARAGRRVRFLRARWFLPMGAALTAAAVIVAFFAVAAVLRRPDAAQQAAAWDRAFAEACARAWTDQARTNPALTPQHQENALPSTQVFSFRDGEVGLRIYVFEPIMFVCSRDDGGQVSGQTSGNSRLGDSFLRDRPDLPITYAAVLDPSGGVEYLVGRVPAGANRITVRTAAGEQVPAMIDGGVFAAWAPLGGLARAQVSAYQDSQQVASGPPVYLRGTVDDALLAEVCDEHVRQRVREIPNRPEGEPDLPPLRFTLADGSWSILLYSSSRIATSCELAADGTVVSGAIGSSYDADKGRWSTFKPYFSIAQLGDRTWILGVAPAGTERVEMVRIDGTVIPVQFKDGFYAVAWHGTQEGDVAKFLFHTPTGVIERPYAGSVGTAG